MGSWRRMGAFLGLVPDSRVTAAAEYAPDRDAYDDDYDHEYSERYADVDRSRSYSRRDHRGAAETSQAVTHGALAMQLQTAPTAVADSAAVGRPTTVKLTGFGEARVVGERYRSGGSVILDMTDLTDAEARRVVDFAAGLAFAMRGSIDKVTTRVFMLLPPDADLSAETRLGLQGQYLRR